MEEHEDISLSVQTLHDISTVITYASTGTDSNVENVISLVLQQLSSATSTKNSEVRSSISTLHLLLQVKVCNKDNFIENDVVAVQSLNISQYLLQNVQSFDKTADKLCSIIHLSLLLMSFNNLRKCSSELILKYENTLSRYLSSENQELDGFYLQISVQLLTVVLSALCTRESTCVDAGFVKSNDCNISHDLVIQLALCQDDTLRAQTLITLIPKIVQHERDNVVLKKLLDVMIVCKSEESLNRALASLSALSSFYLPDTDCKVSCSVDGNNLFWLLIQQGLCSNIPLSRKHALYLVRRCINALFNGERSVSCDMFLWTSSKKEKLFRWWQDVCTILEVLEERAFHLINPVLKTFQDIFCSCVKEINNLSTSPFLTWCFTVFRQLLQHSCIYVVKWGVDTLLGDIGCNLVSSKYAKLFYSFFFETLIPILNLPQIFYEVDDVEIESKIPELVKLEKFFVCAAGSETREEFFVKLIDVMGTINWAPIPLFIVMQALSQVPSFKCLNPKDTAIIKRLVSKILATQNVSIRIVSLQNLFTTVIKMFDSDHLDLKALLDVLTAFCFDVNLSRGSELWNFTSKWLSSVFNEAQVVSWINEIAANSDYSTSVFAQLIVLFFDAGLLRDMDSLGHLFSSLTDCDSRLYVDQEIQTRSVELLAHMARICCTVEVDNKQIDRTKEAILILVQATACNVLKLLKIRLFSIENLPAYQMAVQLLICFELFCNDKEVALNFVKEKPFSTLLLFASDIVCADLVDKKINFFFAMNVLKLGCKAAKDTLFVSHMNEISSKVMKEILQSDTLVQPPFGKNSTLPSWTAEIMGSVSSGVLEAQWEFLTLCISESCTEDIAVQIVDAVGIGLDIGGRNMLPVLLKDLHFFLAKYPKSREAPTGVLRHCWSNILEVRHKDIFYSALREFLRAIFQPEVVASSEWGANFANECGQALLSMGESAFSVVGELTFALQNLVHLSHEVVLQRPIRNLIVSCLVFSAIHRRDQKLLRKITSTISSNGDPNSALQLLRDDPLTFVRCTAIEIFVFLLNGRENWRRETADLLMQNLLEQTESPNAKKARYYSNSLTHRIHFRVLQGLALVEPTISLESKYVLGKWLLKRLLHENHQLSVRYLTEWMLVRISCSVPKFQTDLLDLVEQSGDIRESALCSVICTLLHISQGLQHSKKTLQECEDLRIFLRRFFNALLPLTMSQAYSVRFNAHVSILQVWDIMEKLQLAEEINLYKISALAVRTSFNRASNKFENHKDFYLTDFHCVEHYSLETLLYDLPRLTLMSRDEWVKPDSLKKTGLRETGGLPLMNKDRRLEHFNFAVNSQRDCNKSDCVQSGVIQKKMVPSKWLEINELQVKSLPEVVRPWKKDGDGDIPSQGLVVVASLLDKASNLGGLSRTCEIMGVSLVLPKMSFATDREFQALSMSSEMWAPLSEVKPHELAKFLTEMRKRGFSLVGAEQTAKSACLSSVGFEENTVLLLGNEREGIPSNLLPLLDFCVEIPQYGLVRSLNVHVAGALFIYEYRRQHSTAKTDVSFGDVGPACFK